MQLYSENFHSSGGDSGCVEQKEANNRSNSHDRDGAMSVQSGTRTLQWTEYSGTCRKQMRFSGLKQLGLFFFSIFL